MQERAIYSNLEQYPRQVNTAIEKTIEQAFQQNLNAHFANYQIAGGSFLVKGFGPGTETLLHQDWNMVDETQAVNFSVWVPLQDVGEGRGCINVVPGSHRWFNTLRGVNMPSVYVKVPPELEHHVRRLNVKAGTAVVFAVNVFHGSEPNLAQVPRFAVHLALTNQHAQTLHALRMPDGTVAEVECAREFLYDFIFNVKEGNIPTGLRVIRTISPREKINVTEQEFVSKLRSATTA
jgi:ectoine hydroxylase-related dioxygenase (phytanoyl-CoA dioxygenase family)